MSKYNRTYHFKWSEGATSDDRIQLDISHLIGKEIVITEKLDGSNSGLSTQGVYARSHSQVSSNPWDRVLWEKYYLIKNDILENQFLFIENMYGIHSIEYNNLKSYYYMFGIRENTTWVSWDDICDIGFLLDIPIVPILFRGIINSEKELIKLSSEMSKGTSKLGGEREGCVVRLASSFEDDDFSKSLLKIVRKDHVTTDTHWTKNWRRSKLNI